MDNHRLPQQQAYLILWSVIEVIEEDAAQAAPLIPVLAIEVLVRPLLEARVVCWVMLVAYGLQIIRKDSCRSLLLRWVMQISVLALGILVRPLLKARVVCRVRLVTDGL